MIKNWIWPYFFSNWKVNPVFIYLKVGALAVLIRQTNIIWVLFISCTGVLDYILTQQKDSAVLAESSPSQGKDAFSVWNQGVGTGSNLRKRRIGNQAATFNSSVHQTVASTKPSSGSLISSCFEFFHLHLCGVRTHNSIYWFLYLSNYLLFDK